jgi:SH3 domain protein
MAPILALIIGLAWTAAVRAETAWISDRLTVPLRSGPSNANRILHRGLPSGTSLEVLTRDEQSGFVEVRTENGTEGWLPAQYLIDQPIARDRLSTANQRVRDLSATIERQKAQLDELNSGKSAADQTSASLSRQVAALEQELAEIKRISAGAITQNETNKELMTLNERLRDEVDELVTTIATLEANIQQRWLLIGGGLVLAGLVLGVAIKARPRRSAWS